MFIKIYAVLAAAIDALLSILLVDSLYDVWIPVLLYIGLFVGLLAFHMIVTLILSLILTTDAPSEKPSRFCKFWADRTVEMMLGVARVKTTVNGAEKIPENRRFLLVSNHRSNLDPMVCMANLSRYHIAFVSKPENFKIPVVGPFIYRCCFMAIDRENPRKAMATLRQATEYVKSDTVSVGIYPEGTRSKTGELLEFKDGVFYIAKKAPCPIVVMTIKNTENVHKNFPLKGTRVTADILKVLEPEEFADKSTHDLGEQVRKIMLENLQ